MRMSLFSAAVISALSISTTLAAQPAPTANAPLQVKEGQWVYTTDGAAVGRIDYVDHAKDGAPTYVGVIHDMRLVHIPANTLSAGQKGYVTSLSKADVGKLR
jgi:hypothetical protein